MEEMRMTNQEEPKKRAYESIFKEQGAFCPYLSDGSFQSGIDLFSIYPSHCKTAPF